MKFKLTMTDRLQYQKGVEFYEKFGFEFELDKMMTNMSKKNTPIYRIVKKPEIEISTLEELLQLQKETGDELIVSEGVIEIYNGYRE